MPQAPAALRRWLTPVLLFTLIALVSGTAFMRKYLGPVTPDQLLFHLQYGGLDYADPRMISRALRYLAGTLLLTWMATAALRRISLRLQRAMWLLLLGTAAVSVGATVDDPCDGEARDTIAEAYVDPSEQRFTQQGQAPDLLIVFIESLDERYAEPVGRKPAALHELVDWRQQGRRLGDMRTLGGSSWTVGGLFSSLCGVPLQPVGLMSRHALEYSTRFFDGGSCLTDVLARQGWELSFYGGASLKFAGKGLFMAKHQVGRRFGKEQWEQQGVAVPDQGWGLLDAALTEQAWHDMQRPRDGDRPRASLLLTVNTHGPSGTADPGCGQSEDGELSVDEQMARALACTDHVVAQLARRFAAQADGRPKLVWIMGDHVGPTPLLFEGSDEQWRHRTLFHTMARFDGQGRSSALPAGGSRVFSHLDVLPTLVEALGLSWQPSSHRLGLGVSLLASEAPPTLLEQQGYERTNARLSCPSPLFHRLWVDRAQALTGERTSSTGTGA
ncbi:sulfatase-like hydrolase/transferase [Pelomonas sp. SE-A7]|uniref:sulfatase-like hydrolase/transferase n=1 Tax=Pelomonas sp. SE-A7 TaxID=3054953 RepID=UPI00259C8BCD|nr:sulfatase-like hydrolase/transferase [Pelomonas sp. SE-A7]MDM4766119.1 sulfatase-like hydrolase/transferase [Pelomonas sp. SE-A7]